jgi:hypothetical protein
MDWELVGSVRHIFGRKSGYTRESQHALLWLCRVRVRPHYQPLLTQMCRLLLLWKASLCFQMHAET